MNEEMEKTSLMDKYIKIHLGGAAYRVRLMTLLLFAAAAILLIAAILKGQGSRCGGHRHGHHRSYGGAYGRSHRYAGGDQHGRPRGDPGALGGSQ